MPLHCFGIECSLNTPPLVGVAMVLFAVPALLEPATRNISISRAPAYQSRGGLLQGVRDAPRHWWLMLNCHNAPVSGRISGPLRCRSRPGKCGQCRVPDSGKFRKAQRRGPGSVLGLFLISVRLPIQDTAEFDQQLLIGHGLNSPAEGAGRPGTAEDTVGDGLVVHPVLEYLFSAAGAAGLPDLFGFPQKLELPRREIWGESSRLPRQSCSWFARRVRQSLGSRPRTLTLVSAATGQPMTGYTISKCASVGWPVFPLIGRTSCGHADMATMQSVSARRST